MSLFMQATLRRRLTFFLTTPFVVGLWVICVAILMLPSSARADCERDYKGECKKQAKPAQPKPPARKSQPRKSQPRKQVSCERGQEKQKGHCCWIGQAWSSSQNKCVGTPDRCPGEMARTQNSCEPSSCGSGKTREDQYSGCCWPGQAWQEQKRMCVGTPQCPKGKMPSREGNECVDDPVYLMQQRLAGAYASAESEYKQGNLSEAIDSIDWIFDQAPSEALRTKTRLLLAKVNAAIRKRKADRLFAEAVKLKKSGALLDAAGAFQTFADTFSSDKRAASARKMVLRLNEQSDWLDCSIAPEKIEQPAELSAARRVLSDCQYYQERHPKGQQINAAKKKISVLEKLLELKEGEFALAACLEASVVTPATMKGLAQLADADLSCQAAEKQQLGEEDLKGVQEKRVALAKAKVDTEEDIAFSSCENVVGENEKARWNHTFTECQEFLLSYPSGNHSESAESRVKKAKESLEQARLAEEAEQEKLRQEKGARELLAAQRRRQMGHQLMALGVGLLSNPHGSPLAFSLNLWRPRQKTFGVAKISVLEFQMAPFSEANGTRAMALTPFYLNIYPLDVLHHEIELSIGCPGFYWASGKKGSPPWPTAGAEVTKYSYWIVPTIPLRMGYRFFPTEHVHFSARAGILPGPSLGQTAPYEQSGFLPARSFLPWFGNISIGFTL